MRVQQKVEDLLVTPRRNDVDWLRITGVHLLFLLHTLRVFADPADAPYHVRHDGPPSFAASLAAALLSNWLLPLLFCVAGFSAHRAMALQDAGDFLLGRIMRLLVPLVVNVALLCPLLRWIQLREGTYEMWGGGLEPAQPDIPLLQFARKYYYVDARGFSWGHLWFVGYLLIMETALSPVLYYIRGRLGRLATPATLPVTLITPAVPLALAQVLLFKIWPGRHHDLLSDVSGFVFYYLHFLCGFCISHHPGFEFGLQRFVPFSLIFGAGAAASLAGALHQLSVGAVKIEEAWMGVQMYKAVSSWCLVAALWGYAASRLCFKPPAPYLVDAAFPLYILHDYCIAGVAHVLGRLPIALPGPAKFAAILAGSVLVTYGVYHAFVRPLPVVRVLFGMMPTPRRGNAGVLQSARDAVAAAEAAAGSAGVGGGAKGSGPKKEAKKRR